MGFRGWDARGGRSGPAIPSATDPGREGAALWPAVLPPAVATAISLVLLHGFFRAVAAATAVFGLSAVLRRRLGGAGAGARRRR